MPQALVYSVLTPVLITCVRLGTTSCHGWEGTQDLKAVNVAEPGEILSSVV